MQLSPLILKHCFVTNLAIKANVPDYPTVEEATKVISASSANISTKVETAMNAENNRLWKVTLQIICKPAEGSFALYVIDAELVGFFEIHASVEESKIADLVASNGPALLFGSAREIVLAVTGRGPLGPFLLPSVSFVDECPSNRKLAASQAQTPAKTTKE